MIGDRPPIIVLEVVTSKELEEAATSLRDAGYRLVEQLDEVPLRPKRVVCRAVIADAPDAAAAVLAASWGAGLLIGIGGLDPALRERLLDDLGRIGPLTRAAPGSGKTLHPQAAQLLDLLEAGHTLGAAARRAFLSRRTADRRLAEARGALGARTTAEAIVRWVGLRNR